MTNDFDGVSIADRLRVEDRIARYSWAIDEGDLAAYLDCFTADGVLRHPRPDGSDAEYRGHAGIEAFISRNFSGREEQGYGHQHRFSSIVQTAEGDDIRVKAYVMIFRHEFHRTYWPRGASWRMGTWHARMTPGEGTFRIAEVDVRMWNDSALGVTGRALLDRGPGMPGTRD